jgi:hypothetical protein
MCDVDQHAQTIEFRDRGTAELAQAAMFRRRVVEIGARIGGVADGIVTRMGERQVTRAQRTESSETRQIGAHREAILHRRHDRQDAVTLGGLYLCNGRGYARGDATFGVAHATYCLKHADDTLVRRRIGFRRPQCLRNVGHETAGRQAAALHLREVDPPRSLKERIRSGRPGDVDMRIEGQKPLMEGKGIGRKGFTHDAGRSQISA